MHVETITRRDDLEIRRVRLEPGEVSHWHTDLCHRFTVVVSGDRLRIEYRDSPEPSEFDVHPGMADWDQPTDRIHRAVNVGSTPFEEVVTFYLDTPGMDPQPAGSSRPEEAKT